MRTVKVLEVGQLDALPHAEDVGCAAEAVQQHPDVSAVEGRDGATRRGLGAVTRYRVLDVGPCCDDRGEDHQAEGEERHAGHAAAEPKHLAVGDQDDGQVLEDGVDRDGEKLDGFAAGVDHSDQQERDGEPWMFLSVYGPGS